MFDNLIIKFKTNFFSLYDNYFYQELLPNYLFGLLFFTLLLMLNQLFYLVRFYVEYNVPLGQVLMLALNEIPLIMSNTIPIGVLPAYLLSMGRFSIDSEIVAMKSCGMSTMRILRPGLIFGILISLATVIFTDQVVVPSNLTYIKLRAKIMAQKPAVELKEKAFVEVGGYKISFENIRMENNIEILYNVHVIDVNGRRTIEAEKGRFYSDPENSGHYILKFMNGSISEVMKNKASDGKPEEKFFISSFRYLAIHSYIDLPQEYYTRGPDTMTLLELSHEVKEKSTVSVELIDNYLKDKEKVRRDIGKYRNELIILSKATGLNTSKEELMKKAGELEKKVKDLKAGMDSIDKNIRNYRKNMPNYYIMKYYEKFSLPIASFVFALMSLSIGMYTARSGRNEGLGLSIIIMLSFFGLKFGSENLIWKGILPPVMEWFADSFFFVIGVVLLINKIKE